MYETHFGFHRQPFQSVDPAKLFFRSESIRGLLPRLTRCLRSSLGIGIVTALHGAGRSTLLRYLKTSMEHEGRTVFVSGSSLVSTSSLHQLLMHCAVSHAGAGLTIESVPTEVSRWSVSELLRRSMDFWGPVLLLIDDVHLAPVSVLNELRALSEEDWQGRTLVRILVSAPVAFEVDLSRPEYENFSHRIRCHEFLQPLTTQESFEFLKRQIESAGPQLVSTFTEQALELIVAASEGLPRSLCLLTDEALAVAAEGELRPVAEDCVRAALNRMKHLSCHWNTTVLESFDDEQAWEMSGHDDQQVTTPGMELGGVRTPTAALHRLGSGVVEFGSLPGNDFEALASAPGMSSTLWPAALTPPPLPPSAFETLAESPSSLTFDFSSSPPGEDLSNTQGISDLTEKHQLPWGFASGSPEETFEYAASLPESVRGESVQPESPVASPAAFEQSDAGARMSAEPVEVQIDPVDFSSVTPIPDRYTWVTSARELFSGDFSLVETEYSGALPDPDLFMPPEIFQDLPGRSSIAIQQVTDQQILELLGQPSSQAGGGSLRTVPQTENDSTTTGDTAEEHRGGFFRVLRPAPRSAVDDSVSRKLLAEAADPQTPVVHSRAVFAAAPVVDAGPGSGVADQVVDEKVTLPMWRDGSLLMAMQAERRKQQGSGEGERSSEARVPLHPVSSGENLRGESVEASGKSEPVAEESESGMPDRFATLFTRLRNIRGQKQNPAQDNTR